MNFNLYMYEWKCRDCGLQEKQVEIGLTSLGELAVFWHCPCGRDSYRRMPLEELIADVPSAPTEGLTEEDLKLLKEMHISTKPPI